MADLDGMVARPRDQRDKIPLPRTVGNLPQMPDAYAPAAERDRIAEFDAQLNDAVRSTNKEGKQPPLTKLASGLTQLNFGDMMEFSVGAGAEAQKVWDWAIAYLAKDMKDGKAE